MEQYKKEERDQAAQVDLLSFLQAHRPADLVREGGGYRSKTYSSLWINNGVWTYYARDNPDRPDKKLAGRSALDFLIKVEGVPITDAIWHINGGSYIPAPVKPPRTPRPFALPAPAKNNDLVIEYLTGRGIEREIIDYCIELGILYQAHKYDNAVFVGRDPQGVPRHACLRGVTSKFRRDVEGSSKDYGFCIPPDDVQDHAQTVFVFESPIDAMSWAALRWMPPSWGGPPEEWRDCYYLSLSGTSRRALVQFLKDHSPIVCVTLCLDNTPPGRTATKNITKFIRKAAPHMAVVDKPPMRGEDYNQYLNCVLQIKKSIHTGTHGQRKQTRSTPTR